MTILIMYLFGMLIGALLGSVATFMYMGRVFDRDVKEVLDFVSEQSERFADE